MIVSWVMSRVHVLFMTCIEVPNLLAIFLLHNSKIVLA